jgi:hypothetical protein
LATRTSDLPLPGVIDADATDAISQTHAADQTVDVVNMHRDERDVRIILILCGCIFVLGASFFVSLASNVWQYFRRPDRIVVDRRADGDHVIAINGKAIATVGGITVGPDRPGDEDKRRLANEWATARYAIDPQSRSQAIDKLLYMMEPTAAKKFVSYLARTGELQRESGERWQSFWKPKLTVIDSTNPYRVNVVGEQELNKVVAGVPQKEAKQIIFSLELMPDKDAGRAKHNQFTGYLVVDLLDLREVTNSGNAGESVLPQQAPVR